MKGKHGRAKAERQDVEVAKAEIGCGSGTGRDLGTGARGGQHLLLGVQEEGEAMSRTFSVIPVLGHQHFKQ